MATLDAHTTAATVGVLVKRAPEYRTVYTNICRGSTTPWDISLIFGRVGDIEGLPPGTQESVDQVGVIMSPEEAKAVLQILRKTIEAYESNFGEIKDLTPVVDRLVAGMNKPGN